MAVDPGPIPVSARLLGYAGLLPFVAGSLYLAFGPLLYMQLVTTALVGYGATILSFMGAIHWGLGLALPAAAGADEQAYRFGISVVPALLGWAALLLTLLSAQLPAFALLLAGFVGVYLLDLGAIGAGLAPPWYRRLRLQLTVVVALCLGLAGATFL